MASDMTPELQSSLKRQAAIHAVTFVESGMVVGLGHGSTAILAVQQLAAMLSRRQLSDVQGIPCSQATRAEALRRIDEHKAAVLMVVGDAISRPIADVLAERRDEFDLSTQGILTLVAVALLVAAGARVFDDGTTRAVWLVGGAIGGSLIGAAAAAQFVVRRRTRAALARLIDELAGAPAEGALEASLSRSLGDPGLRVAYWSPERGAYVAPDGSPFDDITAAGRAATPVHRGVEPVAVIVHRASIDPADIEHAFRPAVRLWLDNARLRTMTRAELADLQASVGGDPEDLRRIFYWMIKENILVKIAEDFVYHRRTLEAVKAKIKSRFAQGTRFGVADFKEMLDLTRKHSIPLLEFLDREKFTRRQGNERILL